MTAVRSYAYPWSSQLWVGSWYHPVQCLVTQAWGVCQVRTLATPVRCPETSQDGVAVRPIVHPSNADMSSWQQTVYPIMTWLVCSTRDTFKILWIWTRHNSSVHWRRHQFSQKKWSIPLTKRQKCCLSVCLFWPGVRDDRTLLAWVFFLIYFFY